MKGEIMDAKNKKMTIRTIKELLPGQTIWDAEIKGFGCRYRQQARVFMVKYRFGKGRTARQYIYTIGRFGSPWTLETAKDEAKKILGRVANGENPAAERQRYKTASTMDEAFHLFIKDSIGKRAERTVAEYRRLYTKLAKASLGRHRLQDITNTDIKGLHSDLSKTPSQANRLLQMLSAFFSWCERNGYRAEFTNPCRHIKKYKEQFKERFLSETELFALSVALNSLQRSMGQADSYPFILSPPVVQKLNFINALIQRAGNRQYAFGT